MIINSRWKIYLDILEVYGDAYEQVLVADTRDLIFQGDIFAAFGGHSNYFGYATEINTLGEDKTFNYPWLESLFGRSEADKLADRKIICAGTVIGTANEMKIFCRELWKILQYHLTDIYDQGVTTYLIYKNLLPIENLIESDVYGGAILTNGAIKDNKIRGEKILRGDGGVPAVVHQYDRHAHLVALVDGLYRDKNFQADERFSDAPSVLDQAAYLLHIGRIDEAAQFCMKNFHVGADFGDNVNRLLKIWEFVLNQPLTPAVGYFELVIQYSLASVKNFPMGYLNNICTFLTHAIKNRRAVYPPFVNFIANALLIFAAQNLNAGNADACFYFINIVNELELPPTKDFYLLQAKAYRTFGRKEAALDSYKKALDLR